MTTMSVAKGERGPYANSMITVWLFSRVVALLAVGDLAGLGGCARDDQDADLDTIDEMSGLDGSDLEETGGDI